MGFGSVDLVEEGVGFGVPVLKMPRETIFPRSLRVTAGPDASAATAEYDMDLVERLSVRTRLALVNTALNVVREPLALLHRRYPALRGVFAGISNSMRAAFGIRTVFEHATSRGTIRVTYRVDAAGGELNVRMEARNLATQGCTELIIMNEQGAHFFDTCTDSAGSARQGSAIETWQEVAAARATFLDAVHGVSFTM